MSDGAAIRAWYKGNPVILGIAANSLVFDGFQFVRPQDAEFVQIVETVSTGAQAVPPPWPQTQTLDQVTLTWTNSWLCKVIDDQETPIADRDIVAIPDPNNGACICGISCQGTDLQYMQVFPVGAVIVNVPNYIPVSGPPTENCTCTYLGQVYRQTVNLPTDLPAPTINDVLVPMGAGLTLRGQVLRSVGGLDLGFIVTGISQDPTEIETNLPGDLPASTSQDILLPTGLNLRTQVLTSVGGQDLGLIVTGLDNN